MFILVSVCVVVLLGIFTVFRYVRYGECDLVGFISLLVLCLLCLALVFYATPRKLGYGHVPDKASSYSEQLEKGVHYRTLSSVRVDNDLVIVASNYHTGEIRVARVREIIPPPDHFRLADDGRPIVIVDLK